MENVNIRLLVTRDGEESVEEALVYQGQSLNELNQRFFPTASDNCNIRWIYLGGPLTESLPSTIQDGTAFHVYVWWICACEYLFLDTFRKEPEAAKAYATN